MKRILISRTDNLGDVILTLPMAGILKKEIPGCYILFLGKAYTRPLIDACEFVDEFLDWDEIRQMLDAGSWMLDFAISPFRYLAISQLVRLSAYFISS